VKLDLGPALRASFPDVKLMMMDDQRTHMVNFANVVLSDPEAAQVDVCASLCLRAERGAVHLWHCRPLV
jgi:hypothetical protein